MLTRGVHRDRKIRRSVKGKRKALYMADFDFARRLVSKRVKPIESEAPKRPGAKKEDSQWGKGKANKSRERKSKNPASEGLWRAARKGELQHVEKKLTWMGGVEWQEPKSGWTALHAAVCNDTDPQVCE